MSDKLKEFILDESLSVFFDPENGNVKAGRNIRFGKEVERKFSDLKDVYINKRAEDNILLYKIYLIENIESKSNRLLKDLEIGFISIQSGMIGNEYIKTLGHFHPNMPSANFQYPEVYTVIAGDVGFLLQRDSGIKNEIVETIFIRVKPDESIIIPPAYGHISINLYNKPSLIMAKVSNKFISDHSVYRKLNGGSFYVTDSNSEGIKFVKNNNYFHQTEINTGNIGGSPFCFKQSTSDFLKDNIYTAILSDVSQARKFFKIR